MLQLAFSPLRLTNFTATTCVGHGRDTLWQALLRRQGGLAPCDFLDTQLDTWIGKVADVDRVKLPNAFGDFDCRNNRLALLGLECDGFIAAVQRAIQLYGRQRVGVFLGTSTSGILQTELAYRNRDPHTRRLPASFNYCGTQNNYSLANFVRNLFALEGPAHVVSSACSSSAKVFASAERMLRLGWIDAAIVGGVDSLCLTTLYGFHSLGLTSPLACRPYDGKRDGLSLGEAAAFALLERNSGDGDNNASDGLCLCGYGESSDAHHMSSPHPQGLGAQMAMRQALVMAGISATQIDYINLHGTATPSNDAAEGYAVMQVFGGATDCSSSKGTTGHCLGAAGAVEAVICALALQHQIKPAGINTTQLDPSLALTYVLQNKSSKINLVLSNSFGFGGSNCSLIFANRAVVNCKQ